MSRAAVVLIGLTGAMLAAPARAQDHAMPGMKMPGMTMPSPARTLAKPPKRKATARKAPLAKPAHTPRRRAHPPLRATRRAVAEPTAAMPEMAGMDHAAHAAAATAPAHDGAMSGTAMSGMAMPGDAASGAMPPMDHASMPGMTMRATGTALPAGTAPPPPPPMDHYADRYFPAAAMARARAAMMREGGAQTSYRIMVNLAEYQARAGRDGYRWDAEAWFGGDINRLTVKTEGDGVRGGGVGAAEVQALYSRAVGPYFDMQAGVRHDFARGRPTTYATIGFEGLAPYWFEVEGAAFVSDRGDLLARVEGYYDQRITQRLILQPRVELDLAAQDVAATRIGSGLSSAELGLRLRYEVARRFAPYVGISWERETGRTARYARQDGERPDTTSFVAGVRMWF